MEIRHISPFKAIFFETTTSIAELGNYVRVVAKELYKTALSEELEIAGPVQWVYLGADGQPETKFQLTILVPVITEKTSIDSSKFDIKVLPAFKCLGKRHDGDWALLGNTYLELYAKLMTQNLIPSGENREYYIHMDFEYPDRNITEVLIGLQ